MELDFVLGNSVDDRNLVNEQAFLILFVFFLCLLLFELPREESNSSGIIKVLCLYDDVKHYYENQIVAEVTWFSFFNTC